MERYICVTCGTQFADGDEPPASCPICEDPRQYVPASGQQWTTLATATDHGNEIRAEGELTGIGTSPSFAIGQRALLVPFGGQPAVGLRPAARRRDGRRGRAARRAGGHRDLAPALLLVHGRVGAALRLSGPPARGRRRVGDATRPGDRALGRGPARAGRRAHADPRRRALPRRHDAAPSRRGRGAADRRHHPGDPRPHGTSASCGAIPTWCRCRRARSSGSPRRSSRSSTRRSTAPGGAASFPRTGPRSCAARRRLRRGPARRAALGQAPEAGLGLAPAWDAPRPLRIAARAADQGCARRQRPQAGIHSASPAHGQLAAGARADRNGRVRRARSRPRAGAARVSGAYYSHARGEAHDAPHPLRVRCRRQ